MQIITTNQEEYLHGIAFPDLASAKGALVVFGEGVAPLSYATYHQMVADGYGYSFHPRQDLKSFIEPVFAEIDSQLERSPSYTRSFVDDDGFGPFRRTSVEIDRTADGRYVLTLYATYGNIGKKIEDSLASAIGMPQSLRWGCVNVVHSPAWHGKFEIDFEPIAHRLAEAGYDHMDGVAIAEAVAAGVRKRSISMPVNRCVVAERDGRRPGITITLDTATIVACIPSTVVANGSVVQGMLSLDRRGAARRKFPTVHITVNGKRATSEASWQDLPILDDEAQKEVRQLTARIATGFKS